MMPSTQSFQIAVLPGDGIGTEVMEPACAILEKVAALRGGFSLTLETLQKLNARIAVDGEDARAVAADYLTSHGFIQ